ncbi:MAG: SdiA-regulated domain-containing protein [Saprospiraceae bacterium]
MKISIVTNLYLIITLSLSSGCKNVDYTPVSLDHKASSWFKNDNFPYSLKTPSRELKMPMVLKEISGLCYLKDKDQLVAINDELGNIYLINPHTSEVEKKIRFQRFGDYEAVEYVNDKFFVSNSKGELRMINVGEDVDVKLLRTRLGYHNNVEGMGYDPENKRLLLACKDQPHLDGAIKLKGKAVYAFSLSEMKLDTTPIFIVKDKVLLKWFEVNVGKLTNKIKDRISSFSPSAIAKHPTSGLLYVTSARGDMLAVFDENGNVKHVELVRRYMEQIEGICFDSKATLYISSEGVSKKGRIFVFAPLE